jgi:hypothetical protein
MRFRVWARLDDEDEGEVVLTISATDEHEIVKAVAREPITILRIEPA